MVNLPIVLAVSGGIVDGMVIPNNQHIVIHDYDISGSEDNIKTDSDGHQYIEYTLVGHD